jgi:hypothetical protein
MANVLNVTSDDLALTYEETLEPELTEWYEQKIDEAARLLIAKVPSIPNRLANGTIDSDLVKDIVLKAVMRVVRNSKGLTSVGEDGVQLVFNPNVSSGDLYYSKADLLLVVGTRTVRQKPARIVQLNVLGW